MMNMERAVSMPIIVSPSPAALKIPVLFAMNAENASVTDRMIATVTMSGNANNSRSSPHPCPANEALSRKPVIAIRGHKH